MVGHTLLRMPGQASNEYIGKRPKGFWQEELTMPDSPLLKRNSTIPIDPLVISDAIVPKLTAGDKQAK